MEIQERIELSRRRKEIRASLQQIQSASQDVPEDKVWRLALALKTAEEEVNKLAE